VDGRERSDHVERRLVPVHRVGRRRRVRAVVAHGPLDGVAVVGEDVPDVVGPTEEVLDGPLPVGRRDGLLEVGHRRPEVGDGPVGHEVVDVV
jgi:hypothetical protein